MRQGFSAKRLIGCRLFKRIVWSCAWQVSGVTALEDNLPMHPTLIDKASLETKFYRTSRFFEMKSSR